jgi:hypothetical protein
MGRNHKYTYELHMKYLLEVKNSKKMATVRIFEVISDEFILAEICTTGNYLGTWDRSAILHESETSAVYPGVCLMHWAL